MATFQVPKTFSNNTVIDAGDHNANWQAVKNLLNGGLDATNFNASAGITGTQLAAGTINTAQLADGSVTAAKIASGVIPSGSYVEQTVSFNSTTYRALNATPLTIVSSPGPGNVIIPHRFAIAMDYTGTTNTGAYNLNLQYTTGAVACSATIAHTVGFNGTADFTCTLPASTVFNAIPNSSIELFASSSPGGSSTNTYRLTLWYSIMATGY